MAKKLPRLSRISLLGIKKHVMADYDLHPFRTDISGDSGIGKSIVADMFQLIFVGKNEYRPATESTNDRPLKTLTIDRYGYVFVNAEVQEGKYLAFGMFINGSTVDPFMIQQGYNWEEYTPLDEPFSYKSILQGTIIPDIDELSDILRERVLCQKMSLKKYHECLMNYELLPVNVHTGAQLKSYAQTLRSFSRGRGFKYDSEYLKKFFFTEEKGKEIYGSFQNQLAEMEADLRDHERMNDTLHELREKEQLLTRLKNLKDQKTEAERVYYLARVVNSYRNKERYSRQIVEKRKDIDGYNTKIRQHRGALLLLKQQELRKQIQEIENKQEHLSKIEQQKNIDDAVVKEYVEWEKNVCERCCSVDRFLKQWDLINQVEELIEKYSTLEKIENVFTLDYDNREARKKLNELESQLRKNRMWEQFLSSPWVLNAEAGTGKTEEQVEALEKKIEYQKSLMKLTDINDSHSLSAWALNNAWEMSPIEESLLVHFSSMKTVTTEKLEARRKYVADPEKLLKKASVHHEGEKGFWIDLGGVYEYVEFAKNRFFTTTDRDKLITFFQTNYACAQQEYDRLKSEVESIRQLQKVINQIGLQAVSLYNRKEDILTFENEPLFDNKTKELFQQQIPLYLREGEIIKHLASNYERLKDAKKSYDDNSKIRQFQLREIAGSLGDKSISLDIETLREILNSRYEDCRTKLEEKDSELKVYQFNPEEIKQLSSFSFDATEAKLVGDIQELTTRIEYCEKDITESEKLLEQESGKYANVLVEYESLIEESFHVQLSYYEGLYYHPEEEEGVAFETKKKEYLNAYHTIVEKYIPVSAQAQFEYSGDFLWLSRSILRSELVDRILNDEDKVLEEIAGYLKEITEEFTRLGGRKLTMLKDLFQQVEEVAINYMTVIDEMGRFFKKNDCEISQGITLQMKPLYSTMYPVAWLNTFLSQLDEHLDNLQLSTGLFADLIEEIDITKMMIKAYLQCGGEAKNIQIEHLLNPLRYFDIDFRMTTEDGEENGGSSGQVYAAVSLLCIARLSLIERNSGKKETKGLRFMPIDEGESSGSNFYLLEKIARQNDYQLIVMSILPIDDYNESGRYQYLLSGTSGANGRICVNAIFDEGKGVETITTAADGE